MWKERQVLPPGQCMHGMSLRTSLIRSASVDPTDTPRIAGIEGEEVSLDEFGRQTRAAGSSEYGTRIQGAGTSGDPIIDESHVVEIWVDATRWAQLIVVTEYPSPGHRPAASRRPSLSPYFRIGYLQDYEITTCRGVLILRSDPGSNADAQSVGEEESVIWTCTVCGFAETKSVEASTADSHFWASVTAPWRGSERDRQRARFKGGGRRERTSCASHRSGMPVASVELIASSRSRSARMLRRARAARAVTATPCAPKWRRRAASGRGAPARARSPRHRGSNALRGTPIVAGGMQRLLRGGAARPGSRISPDWHSAGSAPLPRASAAARLAGGDAACLRASASMVRQRDALARRRGRPSSASASSSMPRPMIAGGAQHGRGCIGGAAIGAAHREVTRAATAVRRRQSSAPCCGGRGGRSRRSAPQRAAVSTGRSTRGGAVATCWTSLPGPGRHVPRWTSDRGEVSRTPPRADPG